MTKDEFVDRFINHLLSLCRPQTSQDYLDLAEYGRQAGTAYWEETEQREEGPEACAEVDRDYWE